MSMMLCDKCHKAIDTDFDVESLYYDRELDCVCVLCRMKDIELEQGDLFNN